jgi:curved DNA-binding protein CbpA
MSGVQLDYYDILQVSPHAAPEIIKAAYRALSKTMHPDGGGSDELSAVITEASEVLLDAVKRQRYDLERRIGKAKTFAGATAAKPREVEVLYVACLGCGAKNRVESLTAVGHASCGSCGQRFVAREPSKGQSKPKQSATSGYQATGNPQMDKARAMALAWKPESPHRETVCGHETARRWNKRVRLHPVDADRLGIPQWADASLCGGCWAVLTDAPMP